MTEPRAALPYDWGDIRQRLQGELPRLLDRIGLRDELHHGKGDGRRIYPRNPNRDDRKAGSFVVWTAGGGAGAWKDYACGDAGDVFDLVAYVEKLRSKMDVYWWALDFLGLDRKGHVGQARRQSDVEAERARREREAKAADARAEAEEGMKSAALFKLWLGLAPIAGTIAETYLRRARGIDLSRLARQPEALRYGAAVEWVDPLTGEVSEWRHVMVSAMTRGRRIVALHRTYLRADGLAKADMPKPKLMIGPVRGTAIRLARGPSGLSPAQAAKAEKRGPLAIGEGIETCLTVAAARPDYRVWAAGSLSLMGLLEWPACASAIVLLRDNDWKGEAVAAFARVEAHWRAQAAGRPVEIAGSAMGSDFNDMVRAG